MRSVLIRGRKHPLLLFLKRLVTLAGCLFEPISFDDLDTAPTVLYEPECLQVPGCQGDACSPNAKHLANEFLGQVHGVALQYVGSPEYPAGQTLLDVMQGV